MPVSQNEREAMLQRLNELFVGLTNKGNSGEKLMSEVEFKANGSYRAIRDIIGAENMKQRFPDLDNDGEVDLHDLWIALDTNQDASVSVAEFLSECLGEHFVSNYDLLEAFDIFRDQLDAIPVENVGDALRALGFNPTESEVMQYINKYDTNADGHLDLEEWKAIVHAMKLSGKDSRVQLRDAFNIVSKSNADLQTDELKFIMKNLGMGLDDAQIDAMVKTVDANSDGKVQYDEFISMVQKLA